VNLAEVKLIVAALDGTYLLHGGNFDMQHDILYIPWGEKEGSVAEALEAAGCHWEDDVESWAHF
jgi:hypothetical protein